MRWLLSFVVVLVAALVLVRACGDEDRNGPAPAERGGGTAVIALTAEPPTLNPYLSPLTASVEIAEPLLNSPFDMTPRGPAVSELLEGEPEITEQPFTVTYRIRRDAVWSDGEPVTARDFRFTWRTVVNPDWSIVRRTGLDLVTRVEIIDDRTVRLHFRAPFAPWRELFTREGILPRHALRGRSFNRAWGDEIRPTTGPFRFERWRGGSDVVLVRNERWRGGPRPALDRLVFRFIPDTATLVEALRSGEVDVATVEPEDADRVRVLDGITVDVVHPPAFDVLLFGPGGRVPRQVRRAIAQAIDRLAIVKRILGGVQADVRPLQNVLYAPDQPEYEPHFDRFDGRAQTAVEALEAAGCRRGGDGVFSCAGRRQSYELLVGAGRRTLELAAQIMQQQLARAGIDLQIRLLDYASITGRVGQGDFDLALLQPTADSRDPYLFKSFLECGGLLNYCDRKVTRLLARAQQVLDAERRAALYNRVDALVAEDLPLLPLYQRPLILAWNDELTGPEPNPRGRLTWNVERWSLRR